MSQTHLPPGWDKRVLAIVNSHGWDVGSFSTEALRFLNAWQKAEGGDAVWNPLNTTVDLPGATNYNSFDVNGVTYHVKNYKRATDGVCATGLTLVNGYYNGILGDLQGGRKPAEQIVRDRDAELRTWGTDPRVILGVLAS